MGYYTAEQELYLVKNGKKTTYKKGDVVPEGGGFNAKLWAEKGALAYHVGPAPTAKATQTKLVSGDSVEKPAKPPKSAKKKRGVRRAPATSEG